MSRIDQMKLKRCKNLEEKKKIFALWEPRRKVDGFGYGSISPLNNNEIDNLDTIDHTNLPSISVEDNPPK